MLRNNHNPGVTDTLFVDTSFIVVFLIVKAIVVVLVGEILI